MFIQMSQEEPDVFQQNDMNEDLGSISTSWLEEMEDECFLQDSDSEMNSSWFDELVSGTYKGR